jgi:hypothetical protein
MEKSTATENSNGPIKMSSLVNLTTTKWMERVSIFGQTVENLLVNGETARCYRTVAISVIKMKMK